MITKVFTPKVNLISAVSIPLYRLLAILLIVKKFKSLSIPKIQVYIWGLQNEENRQKLKTWKMKGKMTEAPWLFEDDIIPIISQCIYNHFLKIETSKSNKISVSLDFAANNFLQEIEGVELVDELYECLTDINKLTDKSLENIEFDF